MLNRFGLPVREWEPAVEAETELQRNRRRIRQGKCVGCGSSDRTPRARLCPACQATSRYCSRCEMVKPLAMFWGRDCKPCQLARQYPQKERAAERMREGARRGWLIERARVAEQQAEILSLKERGWTLDEIARRYGISKTAARRRIERAKKVIG